MIKANIGNFLLVGVMALLFIVLSKSLVAVTPVPNSVKEVVFAA